MVGVQSIEGVDAALSGGISMKAIAQSSRGGRYSSRGARRLKCCDQADEPIVCSPCGILGSDQIERWGLYQNALPSALILKTSSANLDDLVGRIIAIPDAWMKITSIDLPSEICLYGIGEGGGNDEVWESQQAGSFVYDIYATEADATDEVDPISSNVTDYIEGVVVVSGSQVRLYIETPSDLFGTPAGSTTGRYLFIGTDEIDFTSDVFRAERDFGTLSEPVGGITLQADCLVRPCVVTDSPADAPLYADDAQTTPYFSPPRVVGYVDGDFVGCDACIDWTDGDAWDGQAPDTDGALAWRAVWDTPGPQHIDGKLFEEVFIGRENNIWKVRVQCSDPPDVTTLVEYHRALGLDRNGEYLRVGTCNEGSPSSIMIGDML